MKKNIFFSLIFLINYLNSYSQNWQSTTIQTPTGVNISAQKWIGSSYNSTDIAFWNSYWVDVHNFEIIEDASPFYNCHGYAWYNVEGNMAQSDLVNIDDRNPNNGSELHVIEKYYSSSSPAYKQVSSNSKANLKVSYYPSDHSAVTTSNPNYFISKLGYGPLVRHTPWDIPFAANGTIKYYDLNDAQINVSYNNTTLLCDGNYRYLNCLNFSDADFNYNWNTSSVIDKINGIGTRYLTIDGSSENSGEGTVSLTVTSPSGLTATSNIITFPWVGKPVISGISGPMTTPNYEWATYTAQLQSVLSSPTDYNWILNPLNGNSVYDYGATCDIAFYNTGNYQLVVQAKNTCPGWGPYYVGNVEVYDDYFIMISPNPTAGESTITIESTSIEKSIDESAEWDLEIYDQVQTLKEKKTKLKGNEYKTQTAGWKEGVYFVRIKYKDKVLISQFVVKQ
jgi:hypothetical protein